MNNALAISSTKSTLNCATSLIVPKGEEVAQNIVLRFLYLMLVGRVRGVREMREVREVWEVRNICRETLL